MQYERRICGDPQQRAPVQSARQRHRNPRRRSVSRVLSRGRCRHRPHGRPSIYATYPGAERAACAPLFGLAPARACRVSLPLPKERASSLWRWSSPHGGRALPASLLCGARTFLGRGLSTDAPAAIRPPPGIYILAESNRCSVVVGLRCRSATRWASVGLAHVDRLRRWPRC